jgi:deferrochelatase/peroxidase EfeB
MTAKKALPTPQAGITNRPPEHLLVVALDMVGSDARKTIEDLRNLLRAELSSDLAPAGDGASPPEETGELGFHDHYDRAHLTVTVGFSSTGYDKLDVTGDDRPQDIEPVPWDKLGDNPAELESAASGDLVLQICADNVYIIEHVLRRIEHELTGQLAVVWAHTGAQRYTSRPGRTARREGRAWIGFLDGTSNLDPARNEDDANLTFVNPDPDVVAAYPKTPPSAEPGAYGQATGPEFPPDMREHPGHEPEWTRKGSYMAIRVSANNLSAWDQQTPDHQEQVIGRTKVDGIALDLVGTEGANAETLPAFAANPSLQTVALAAHIRKANPRGPQDAPRRIFRRGYPLYEASHGQLRRGLIFIAFARTLSTQFEFITRGWLTNARFPSANPPTGADLLREFDKQVLTGGYYFVPPLEKAHEPWGWIVPPASA